MGNENGHEYNDDNTTTLENNQTINIENLSRNTNVDFDISLDPNRYLKIQKQFIKFIPQTHAHKDISKLFRLDTIIYESSNGCIFKGYYKNQKCSIKRLPKPNNMSNAILFTTEVIALKKLRKNSGILQLFGAFYDEKYYYIVTDLCFFDLHSVIEKYGKIPLKKVKVIIYQILMTLDYIHSKNICHRDLKPENILFKDKNLYQPIICDFGDCEMITNNKIYKEFVGTPGYMSPERLCEAYYGWEVKKSDLFACGCICFELLSGERLFDGHSTEEIFDRTLNKQYNEKLYSLDSKSQSFILKLVEPSSKKRLSVRDALNQSYLQYAKYKIAKIENKNRLSESSQVPSVDTHSRDSGSLLTLTQSTSSRVPSIGNTATLYETHEKDYNELYGHDTDLKY